jgi:hypothetical protein
MNKSKLKQIIRISDQEADDDILIKWNKLNKQQLIQIVNDNLIKDIRNEFERNILVDRIVDLYLKSQEESINKFNYLNRGYYNDSWIIPIVSDKKILFVKNENDNFILETSNAMQKEIVEFKKKLITTNFETKIINLLNPYKTNLESNNGVIRNIKNSRIIIRNENIKDRRIAIANEDLNIIGFYLDFKNLNNKFNFNLNLTNCCPHDFSIKEILNSTKNKLENEIIKIKNEKDYTNAINKIIKIYKLIETKKIYNIINYFSYKDLKFYSSKNYHKVENILNIEDPFINYVYNFKYPYFKKFNDTDLQRLAWLNNTYDKGNLYFNYIFILNQLKNTKSLSELLKSENYNEKVLDSYLKKNIIDVDNIETVKNYIKNIFLNIKKHDFFMNMLIYKKKLSKNLQELKIKNNKLKLAIKSLYGTKELNDLLDKEKEQNIRLYDLLTKEKQKKVDDYILKNEDKINFFVCEFDDLRKKFVNSNLDKDKYLYLKELLNTFSNNKFPSLNSKDQNIYCTKCKKSTCKNKSIACMHEKYFYIDLIEAKSEKEKEKINLILNNNFLVYSESEGYYECKFCKRFVKNTPGIMHDKMYENDKLITKDGIKTEQEKYLLSMAEEFINFSSRFDLNKEQIVSACIKSIIMDIDKIKFTDKRSIKIELIEVSFIAATFIQLILVSKNFKLNTNICKIVNFKIKDLINYCLCIIRNKFPLIYKKASSIKLDLYKTILNRISYMDNSTIIKNLKSDFYILDMKIQYNKKHELFKKYNNFERMLEKNNIKIKENEKTEFMYYLSKKYLNLIQMYYKQKNRLEFIDIKTNKRDYLNYADSKYIHKIKNLLISLGQFEKYMPNKFNFNKKIKDCHINFKYWDIFKEKVKQNQISDEYIENYFSKVCLDNLPHIFNNNNHCYNCGRSIKDIDKIPKKDIPLFKRYYNLIKKTDTSIVPRKIYSHDFKNDESKYKTFLNSLNINKKINIDLISKNILKFVGLSKSSKSIDTESSSSDINLNISFTNFLKDLGLYKNMLNEEIIKAKKDIDIINIRNKYDRIRMYNLKQYIHEFFSIINLLKNKQLKVNIKNIYGYEYLDKYIDKKVEFELIFKTFFKKFSNINIEEIINEIIYNDTYKKKNQILYNILFSIVNDLIILGNDTTNKFLADFFIILRDRTRILDITRTSKNTIIDKDEEQKKLQYDKIYRITDDEMVDLGLDYIDLKKITDVEEYQDVIDTVEDYRNKEMDYDFDYDSNNVDDLPDFEQYE